MRNEIHLIKMYMLLLSHESNFATTGIPIHGDYILHVYRISSNKRRSYILLISSQLNAAATKLAATEHAE